MKKSLKKLSVLLLSLGAVLMLSMPALAAPGGAVLNAKCVPGDTPSIANGLVFDLYKVADAAPDGSGGFSYTLTEDFAASGVRLEDITAIVGAGQNSTAEAHKTLLRTLADYINGLSSSTALRAGQSTAQKRAIGANREETEAVAQFTDLSDGLYLVASQNRIVLGNTTYTPIPFLIDLPYQISGTSHTYVTAHVKFDVQTTTDPGPGPGPGPGPNRPGGTPTPPPGPGRNPTPPTTTVEDPAVPLAPEPEIEVLPDPVPMTETPEAVSPEVEIPENRTPLDMLPQTGLLWWPVGVMAAAGCALVACGMYRKKRA